jgi:anti-sigma regulatory factor (Ser/Thr protein kinase)
LEVVDLAQPKALPHTAEAPRLARRYLAARAAAWPAELLDLVVLLTSELVTNAVIHGRRPVELRMGDNGDQIKIEISDGGPDPLPREAGRPPGGQVSGRGLLIVASLADRWGCRLRRTPPGKTVWFELRYQPAADAGRGAN